MAIRLSTALGMQVPYQADNSGIIRDFYKYMKANGTAENYKNQNPKTMIVFVNFQGRLIFLMSKVNNR